MGSQELFTIVLGVALILLVLVASNYNKRKYKTLTIFQISSYFYCLIYALVPIYYMFNIDSAPLKVAKAYNTNTLFQVMLLGIFGYLILICAYEFGSKVSFKRKVSLNKYLPLRKYRYWAFITFFIGMFGVMIEIQLQGGLINSIKNIELLRSFGIESNIENGTSNPLVFFRMFKYFIIFSFFMFLILSRFSKDVRHNIMSALTFFIALYTIFINGGRTHIIIFLVTVFAGFFINRKNTRKRRMSIFKKMILTLLMISLGIVSLIVFDPIFAYLTFGKPIEFSTTNIDSLVSQFSFPFSNMIFVLQHEFPFRFFQDLFLWAISLLPAFITSRMGIPETTPLYEYNTVLQNNSMVYGGIPNDILTLGYYQFGIVGMVITILIFGIIISRLDYLVSVFKDNVELKPIVLRVVIYIGMIVMYADLEGTFRGRYDVILLIFVLYDISKYKLPGENLTKSENQKQNLTRKVS